MGGQLRIGRHGTALACTHLARPAVCAAAVADVDRSAARTRLMVSASKRPRSAARPHRPSHSVSPACPACVSPRTLCIALTVLLCGGLGACWCSPLQRQSPNKLVLFVEKIMVQNFRCVKAFMETQYKKETFQVSAGLLAYEYSWVPRC